MRENYFYYDPTSDCNTCISQYDYDRLSKEDKKKYMRMDGSITNPQDCESIAEDAFAEARKTYEENKRLKEQLDREIHINRKLVKALKMYANLKNWFVCCEFDGDCVFLYKNDSDGYKIAQEVLKEIEKEE